MKFKLNKRVKSGSVAFTVAIAAVLSQQRKKQLSPEATGMFCLHPGPLTGEKLLGVVGPFGKGYPSSLARL